MANRVNDWQGLINLANEDLKQYGAMLLHHEDEEDGTFSLDILYGVDPNDVTKYEECDTYAENYYEDEMSELVNEAWSHARAKAKERKAKKESKHELFVRLGIYINPTDEELDKILKGDTDVLQQVIREKRFSVGGDTYIPSPVVEQFNEQNGTNYEVDDYGFELYDWCTL